ncbi:hypothetical protein GQX74_011395 [Glossina fuscipes]|nr:hypothetical protein GQX74_011395 [Glossina fuscipes]
MNENIIIVMAMASAKNLLMNYFVIVSGCTLGLWQLLVAVAQNVEHISHPKFETSKVMLDVEDDAIIPGSL